MAGPLFFLDGCSAEYDRFVDGPVRGLAPVLAAAPAHRIEGRAVAAAGGCGRAAAHRRHLLGHDGLAGDTEAGDRHAGHRLDGGAAAGAGDAGAGRRTAAVAPAPPAARGIGIARPQAASRGRCAGAAGQWLWCQPGHGGAQAPADRRGDQGSAGRLRRLPRAAADRHPCQPPADR
ncbi:hypothetical protein G6F35_017381 [Rhizopus arrhizus]|nr:hypothetical protein G6F35_017381 [Rhizopus arrhizus]